jgi:Flp pilus assembly protein TadG
MVEFALTAPVFLLILVGLLDLGQAFHQYTQLVNGVREGARVATYDQNVANIQNTVIARTGLGLTASNVTVTCYAAFTSTTKTCGSGLDLGDGVKVTATKDFSPITGRIIAIVGNPVPLRAEAMRSIQ